MPKGKNNLVERAALLLKKISSGKNLGAKIILVKKIPIKAGFGGGSSDAAATIRGLQKLWKIEISGSQLEELTKELGQDFFYSYFGALSQFEGEDNRYRTIPFAYKLPEIEMLIVEPKAQKPSSAWMYNHLITKNIGRNLRKLELLKGAIAENNCEAILDNLHNDFEGSVMSFYPVVKEIKDDLKNVGARRAILAGAGLAVVGFFNSKEAVKRASDSLRKRYKQVIITKPKN